MWILPMLPISIMFPVSTVNEFGSFADDIFCKAVFVAAVKYEQMCCRMFVRICY